MDISPSTSVIEVCGQIYPEQKARDIFDHKVLMTEVKEVNTPGGCISPCGFWYGFKWFSAL